MARIANPVLRHLRITIDADGSARRHCSPENLPMRLPALALVALLSPAAAFAAPQSAFPPAPAPQSVVTSPKPATGTPQPKKSTTTIRGLAEPRLMLSPQAGVSPRVALTFDACSGKTDRRILDVLVANRIPATIFATARWLKRNPEAVAVLKANPDLFEIENHGAMHVPAVDKPGSVYGIPAAGSAAAVETEVKGGAEAIAGAGFPSPRWFRGATARYTASSMEEVGTLGFRVAGFSLNGDDGASVSAATAEKRLAGAKDGAVIIAHINQPDRSAGAGIAKGILALKARGVTFVRLEDATEEAGTRTGH